MSNIITIPKGTKARILYNYLYGFPEYKGSAITFHTDENGKFVIPSHIYFEDDGTFVMQNLFITPIGGQDDYAEHYMKRMGFWKLIKQAFKNLWKNG